VHKLPDYYVSFVKEYLELQDFIVKTEEKYRKRRGWADIDIIAVKIEDNKITKLIVGEVKGEGQTVKEIQEIDQEKFENEHVKKKFKELFGSVEYEKYLYCWSLDPKGIETAKKLGITPVPFNEIVDFMLRKLKEKKGWFYLNDYPNLMLLQFLTHNGYLKQNTQA
jgi:hypothetical protein